jgi:hypothetical protein
VAPQPARRALIDTSRTRPPATQRPAPPRAAVGDAAFTASLKKLVNMRRIAFQHDIYTVLPCTSAADATVENAMPACPDTIVPTPNPSGQPFWPG